MFDKRKRQEYELLKEKFNRLVKEANDLKDQRCKEMPNETQWHYMSRNAMVDKAAKDCFGSRCYDHPILSDLSYNDAKKQGRL